jgi:speckle-type POZ protein
MSGSTNTKLIEFTWKITNYRQQKLNNGPGKWIRSQAFPVDCEGDLVKFFFQFYPQGCVQSGDTGNQVRNGEKWASLFLNTEGSKKYDTSHHIEFSILDAHGEKFGINHFRKKIPINSGYPKFIHLTDLENPANNLLPNDTLTICCRVEETESKTEENCNCQIEQPQTAHNRRKFCEDLASITAHKYADFVFKVENVKIPAHRVILATRSPVFAAMFQHDMTESKTNEAEVTDVTPESFKALLRFIYTGHCEVGNLAEELLVAANKYDIPELKQLCAKELGKKLTVGNAVRLLILSDLHQAKDLKDGVMRFINKNAAAVTKTPSWINFPDSHQYLIRELYNKLVE